MPTYRKSSDAVYINRFVARTAQDSILSEDERYVIQLKTPFGTHANFNCGYAQWKEIREKYGLTARWFVWRKETASRKDGSTYDKLTEIETDEQGKETAK